MKYIYGLLIFGLLLANVGWAEDVTLAKIETEKGTIICQLYEKAAPGHCENFIKLATDGFYKGLTFHRVVSGFVVQGGDPNGDGTGGPGYTIPAEILLTHTKGALAMARTADSVNPERESSGSQFYICLDELARLDGGYSVFGQTIEGMDVVENIQQNNKIVDITIEKAEYDSTQLKPLEMTIANIETDKGTISCFLHEKYAPVHCENFIKLANEGFYDGLTFHRVVPGFVIQGGDPNGDGSGGPGYTLPAEIGLTHHKGGLAMARKGDGVNPKKDSSGSQFYICLEAQPNLDQMGYSVFGYTVDGMDVIEKIQIGDKINRVSIEKRIVDHQIVE